MSKSFIKDNDVWDVIGCMFDYYGFMGCQINSYNDFVQNQIHKIIEENSVINVDNFKIKFGDLYIENPIHKEVNEDIRKVTPKECIDRDMSYVSNMYVDIQTDNQVITKMYKKVYIGYIPCLVYSCLCNLTPYKNNPEVLASLKEDVYEQGGYFVVKGSPKVIASLNRTLYNKVFIREKKKDKPNYELYASIRSYSPPNTRNTTFEIGLKKGLISAMLPYIDSEPIPFGILMKALGVINDKDIFHYFLIPNDDYEFIEEIQKSLEYSYILKSQKDALMYIGKKGKKFIKDDENDLDLDEIDDKDVISYAKHILGVELFPHLGKNSTFVQKRYFVCYMVKRLIDVKLGRLPLDDRDHYSNKLIITVGVMMTKLFSTSFKRMCKELENKISANIKNKNIIDMNNIVKPSIIENAMHNAISTSAWFGRNKQDGVSQAYDRFNHNARLSNARKVIILLNKDGGKIEKPREIDPSEFGVICPSCTPEGKQCGLVNDLALSSIVAVGSDPEHILEYLENMDILYFEELDPDKEYHNYSKLFLNGNLLGLVDNPIGIVNELKDYRRDGCIDFETSISYQSESKEVRINTEAGRIMRPLFIVENGRLKITKKDIKDIRNGKWNNIPGGVWLNLLEKGLVEIIDKTEEENALVKYYPREVYNSDDKDQITHCEFHPSLIFGVGASLIPFPDHNQSPRNTYQASMGKQAIGVPGSNYTFMTKGKFYALESPQIPLVTTKATKYMGYDNLPSGQNAIVVIGNYKGYNQEDSGIMNQSSIDRGFMVITKYEPYSEKISKEKNEIFEVPDPNECLNFRGRTDKLDPYTGIVPEGIEVENKDVIIGKTIEINNPYSSKTKENLSVIYDHPWPGIVHQVTRGINGDGYEYVNVVISQRRKPICGDKFSSRHGQKCTIGAILKPEDMYFTASGISPDMIINPLAFPSRMTIGMMIEMILGRCIASTKLHETDVKDVFNYDTELDEWHNPVELDAENVETVLDGDATPFSHVSVKEICDELKRLGIDECSDEIMINGATGEKVESLMFMGVAYYQRLKHMVIDKIHARSKGGRTRLTRQPREGRRLGGGFRIGYMESDAIFSQGCSYFAKDRLMEQSDEYSTWFCKICGIIALVTLGSDGNSYSKECTLCGGNNIGKIKLPYATKLFIQEQMGMNIILRVLLTSYNEPGDVVYIKKDNKKVGSGILIK